MFVAVMVMNEAAGNACGDKYAFDIVANVGRASRSRKGAEEYVTFVGVASNSNLEIKVVNESVTGNRAGRLNRGMIYTERFRAVAHVTATVRLLT